MTIEIVPTDTLTADSTLARDWIRNIAGERNLYAMYQSPVWLNCLRAALPSTPLLLTQDAQGASPHCLAVLAREDVPLRFRASRRQFASANLRALELLGGRALGDCDLAGYERIVTSVFERFRDVDAIYLKSVPNDSSLWTALQNNGWRLGKAHAYRPDGARPFHFAEFPASFDAYMGEFRKKQRYNLKRQVRLMAESVGNALTMELIERPEQIDGFLEAIRAITTNSWKADLEEPSPDLAAHPEVLRAVAAAGLLRGYLLSAAGKPAAYALGYRFENIYHYANIGYDQQYSAQSPGAVLLLMMIEDLIDKAGVQFMNFGITDANYKRVFGNRHIEDASVLILRPGLRTAGLRAAHSAFEGFKNFLRRRARAGKTTAKDASKEASGDASKDAEAES